MKIFSVTTLLLAVIMITACGSGEEALDPKFVDKLDDILNLSTQEEEDHQGQSFDGELGETSSNHKPTTAASSSTSTTSSSLGGPAPQEFSSPFHGELVFTIAGESLAYDESQVWFQKRPGSSCLCCAYSERVAAFQDSCVDAGFELVPGYESCCTQYCTGYIAPDSVPDDSQALDSPH